MEEALRAGEQVSALSVRGGDAASVDIVAGAGLRAAVAIGASAKTDLSLPDDLTAPVRAGQIVGTARLVCGGEVLAECPLVAASDVEARSFLQSLRRIMRRWVLRFNP